MSAKLRLVKVRVQPVFVLVDDDGSVIEVPSGVVDVPAKEWSTYPTKRFKGEHKEWQSKIDAATPPKPNRAARRKKGASTARL